MSLGLGDLPGWITAIVAIGGVLYGAFNLRAIRQQRETAQASRVYITISSESTVAMTVSDDAPVLTDEELQREEFRRETVTVYNSSDEPVMDVAVSVHFGGQVFSSEVVNLLEPGAKWSTSFERFASQEIGHSFALFRDSAGARWNRYLNGELIGERTSPYRIRYRRKPRPYRRSWWRR